jgi:hypothetical protein
MNPPARSIFTLMSLVVTAAPLFSAPPSLRIRTFHPGKGVRATHVRREQRSGLMIICCPPSLKRTGERGSRHLQRERFL